MWKDADFSSIFESSRNLLLRPLPNYCTTTGELLSRIFSNLPSLIILRWSKFTTRPLSIDSDTVPQPLFSLSPSLSLSLESNPLAPSSNTLRSRYFYGYELLQPIVSDVSTRRAARHTRADTHTHTHTHVQIQHDEVRGSDVEGEHPLPLPFDAATPWTPHPTPSGVSPETLFLFRRCLRVCANYTYGCMLHRVIRARRAQRAGARPFLLFSSLGKIRRDAIVPSFIEEFDKFLLASPLTRASTSTSWFNLRGSSR